MTIWVQELFPGRLAVQVVVPRVKSPAFGPVIAILLMAIEEAVVLWMVIVLEPLLDPTLNVPNGLSLGLKEIAEPLGKPFPKSCTDWGLLEASLVN